MDIRPIGIFDSGIGGLSVLRHLHAQMPNERLLYLADQAHVPYGPRRLEQVRAFSVEIARFLLTQRTKLIVVACNTASAAALNHLRATFPRTTFVGMEPAVKPAAASSRNKIVGVLATQATFQGELFASLVERFASDVIVLEKTLPGLVERIEAGDLTSIETRKLVESAVQPLLDQGADSLVLGCTHYPFIQPILQEIVGGKAEIVDPSPAVARQAGRILHESNRTAPTDQTGEILNWSTQDGERLARLALELTGVSGLPTTLKWYQNPLRLTFTAR